MTLQRLPLAVAGLLALTAVAGCAGSSPAGGPALFVRAAPADGLAPLYVSFTKVEAHRASNETGEHDDRHRDSADGNESAEENESAEPGNMTGDRKSTRL